MTKPWFRWWVGAATDPKLAVVARKAGAKRSSVLAVWAVVLERAAHGDEPGVAGDLPADEIAVQLDLEEGEAEAILAAMVDKKMIDQSGRVSAWPKRQPERDREDDGAADRKRRQRERERAAACRADGDVSRNVTPRHATSRQVTPPEERRREESREEEKGDPPRRPPAHPPPNPADPVIKIGEEIPGTAPGSDTRGNLSPHDEQAILAAVGRMGFLSEEERVIGAQLMASGCIVDDIRAAYAKTIDRGKPRNGLRYLRNIATEERDARQRPRVKSGLDLLVEEEEAKSAGRSIQGHPAGPAVASLPGRQGAIPGDGPGLALVPVGPRRASG